MPSSKNDKQKRCGLIMPISAIDGYPASHWEEVFLIIKEALSDTRFQVELVSNSDEIGVIQKRIVQNIYDNEIVICDVSAKNPNVMFELGMRLAFDKPAIIIKDNRTNYSFDTAAIEHLEYPVELNHRAIQDFQAKLREKVIANFEASKRPEYTTFLKQFGQFVVAKIEEKKVGKDDYLLEPISELRIEVEALRKTVTLPTSSSRLPRFTDPGVRWHTASMGLPPELNKALKTESELMTFIKNYSNDHDIDHAMLADLQNSESVLFKDLFKRLSKAACAQDYLGDMKALESALIAAANRLNQLWDSKNSRLPD
jgi:hypothetical protein